MKVRSIAAFCVLVLAVTFAGAAPITVTTADNSSLPGDGVNSLDEALRAATDGDLIRFNIPGPGPHYIKTPIGGYPLITAHNLTIDGYSQPGSRPNTNSILGGNGAQIQIVLDSTGDEWLPNDPQDPGSIARRSTRILHSGYGDTENGIFAVFGADNLVVRGLSFISRRTQGTADDPVVYAVALVNEATNARIQGCWFGIAPGGVAMADVKPVSSAVAAFRFQIGGNSGPRFFSSGCIIGTDGDGSNDRAEFNVMVGCRIAMALEAPGVRVAGNYVNVFPDGLSFVDIDQSFALWRDAFIAGGANPAELEVSIENLENGDLPENSIVGTNGDGVSDADERNVFGNTVYLNTIEFYRAGPNIVLAGNYFGVGVDGTTPAPASTNIAPDFLRVSKGRTNPLIPRIRVGSNGDGVSDELEGNLIVNVRGLSFFSRDTAGTNITIVSQRNRLVNCDVFAVPFSNGSNVAYSSYYLPYLANSTAGVIPALTSWSGAELKGNMAAPSAAYPYVTISVYLCDIAGMNKTNFWPNVMTHPGRHLLSFTDNGPEDLDLDLNKFTVSLGASEIPSDAYLAVAATYSGSPVSSSATNAVTSPMSNPISREPRAQLRLLSDGNSEISWIAPPGVFAVEVSDNLSDPEAWFPIATGTYHLGRYVALIPTDYGSARAFFRVVAP